MKWYFQLLFGFLLIWFGLSFGMFFFWPGRLLYEEIGQLKQEKRQLTQDITRMMIDEKLREKKEVKKR